MNLHKLVREILWIKEGGRCVICGRPASDAAHIYVRNRLATTYDTAEDGNVHLLCRDCHNSDHSGSGAYRRWYEQRWGSERSDRLTRRANVMVMYPKMFIERRAFELKEELDSLSTGTGTQFS